MSRLSWCLNIPTTLKRQKAHHEHLLIVFDLCFHPFWKCDTMWCCKELICLVSFCGCLKAELRGFFFFHITAEYALKKNVCSMNLIKIRKTFQRNYFRFVQQTCSFKQMMFCSTNLSSPKNSYFVILYSNLYDVFLLHKRYFEECGLPNHFENHWFPL